MLEEEIDYIVKKACILLRAMKKTACYKGNNDKNFLLLFLQVVDEHEELLYESIIIYTDCRFGYYIDFGTDQTCLCCFGRLSKDINK